MSGKRFFAAIFLSAFLAVTFWGCNFLGSSSDGDTTSNPVGATSTLTTIPTVTQSFDVPITTGLATKNLTFISPFGQKAISGKSVSGTVSAAGNEILGIFDADNNPIYLSLNNLNSSALPTGSIRALVGKSDFSPSANADVMIMTNPILLGADDLTRLTILNEIKQLPKYLELVAINQTIAEKGESAFDFDMHPESFKKGVELFDSYFATKTTTSAQERTKYIEMVQDGNSVTFQNYSFIYYEAAAENGVFNIMGDTPIISSVDAILQWANFLSGDFTGTKNTLVSLATTRPTPTRITVTKSTTFNTIKCIFLFTDVVTGFSAANKMTANLKDLKDVGQTIAFFTTDLLNQPTPRAKIDFIISYQKAKKDTIIFLLKKVLNKTFDDAVVSNLITVVAEKVIGGWVKTGYTLLDKVAPFLNDLAFAPSTREFTVAPTSGTTTTPTTPTSPIVGTWKLVKWLDATVLPSSNGNVDTMILSSDGSFKRSYFLYHNSTSPGAIQMTDSKVSSGDDIGSYLTSNNTITFKTTADGKSWSGTFSINGNLMTVNESDVKGLGRNYTWQK